MVSTEVIATQPLRFCMLTTFYPPYNFGGDGIYVQRLALALAERGHHVTIIHCVDSYRLAGGSLPQKPTPTHPNITVHPLRSPAGPLSPLVTHQLAIPGFKRRQIERILAATDFDVIHFHNTSLVGGPGVLAYGNAIKLYTAHEYWLVCPLSTLWKYDREPCTQKQCVRCTLRAGKPPQWWRMTPLLEHKLQHVDALLSPSRFLIDKHREMGLDAQFTHLPNFLPLAQGERQSSPAASATGERPYFLMVGRLEKSKGFQRVIEVFRDFTAADLLIVGSGPYAAELQALAADCEHIRFRGQLDYAELVGLYRDAVTVIVPSLWYEPFGLIVIEAFAQRTPVIVNNAGALPELVADSDGGIVYNTAAQLRAAMEQLLGNPQQRLQLGQNGYDAYLALWTEERFLAGYFTLIENIRQQHSHRQ